ncbi:MAG TPA: TadE/TadG family type IV pilus assembly protein [Pararhizobium sp.]|jgi:Flp pilus assembly protein TadG|uniref:TadE/TadG family type IV pilus assembly protein n=1 Tax=Pararhizobium sp. TaxID=1977563 RepID=UPI002CFA95C2|nr:TadE/TadG family type IV pilus assembly protein [Pararhizobium sp.]HTO33720.1 TadE/TadG family type IV pilus assembly protein [Pararhizobium sp.]
MTMKTAYRHSIGALSRKAAVLRAFFKDRRGTGGVEFAIIVPLLIAAYLGSFELTLGYSVARKVARAASTVTDILTREDQWSKNSLNAMPNVVKGVMAPFQPKNGSTLKVTGIKVMAPGVGVVVWSRGWSGNWAGTSEPTGSVAYIPGIPVTFPDDIAAANDFIVRTEIDVPHDILLFAADMTDKTLKPIHIAKTYYFRQRIGNMSTCSDCAF